MFYIKGKYIKKLDNEIIFETDNGVGYKGIYIGRTILKNDEFLIFYIVEYQNSYGKKIFIFDDIRYYDVLNSLLKINNIGAKIVGDIFSKYTIEEFDKIIKSRDVKELETVNNISNNTSKIIINALSSKVYKINKNSKRTQVIESLKNVGYSSKSIIKVIDEIDFSNNYDFIINEAIIKIGELNE